VEVASLTDTIAVRDSKVAQSPILIFSKDEWRAFVQGVRSGDFE